MWPRPRGCGQSPGRHGVTPMGTATSGWFKPDPRGAEAQQPCVPAFALAEE